MTTGETLRSAKPWFAQLNSLRAIAFLLVFLFHDAKLPTGYIGVDLFFVISGYLITSLLMWELE